MKKIITSIFFILLFISTGCNKLLDVDTVSYITTDSYWQGEGDVTGYTTGIYSGLRTLVNTTYYGEDRSDAFVQGLEGSVTVAWAQTLTAANAPSWLNYYNVIHNCNLLIKYGSEVTPVTDNINRCLAQGYFIRAYTYLMLIKAWGEVPLVLEPTETSNSSLPSRSPATDVMTQILSDIDESISLFPEDGYVDKNRASKPAAYALKADALLWKNKVLDGTDDDLTEAIAAVDKVMASGISLLSDFTKIHDTGNKKNGEIIFSIYFLRDEESDQYGSRLKPRTLFVASAANKSSIAYSTSGARSVYAPSDTIQNLFSTSDVRKAASVITAVDASNNIIGVFDNKFRGTAYSDDRYWENDIVVYRAAEMILFRAEALAALNREDEAVAELNKIRSRAGTGDYNGATDKQSVEKEIFNERFRELWFELKRWPDIVRFHYGGTVDAYSIVPNLEGKTIPLFFPIPTDDMNVNSNLEQTAGY
jgi:starch-binding outer membrane protein, SusD/RagB family